MTRVNIGVDPAELCDQHLIAEYRELPRVFAYCGNRVIPGPFRLGRGHVLWCAQFPGTLAARYRALVCEMRHRGFAVAHENPRGDGAHASAPDIAAARLLVCARILERLGTMRRAPRWTARERPPWARIA